MKELLKSIQKNTKEQYKFAELKEGKAYYLSTGRRIPDNHVCFPKHKTLEDGLYRLSPYTCGGAAGCEIGKPAIKCVASGTVNKRQCGKYSLCEIGSFCLRANTILKIIKDTKDEGSIVSIWNS